MVARGLLDLQEETIIRIAQFIVYDNAAWEGFTPITPCINDSDFRREQRPVYTNEILAFLSTCKRVRDSVKPFGLIWCVTIDERERARDWIGCVPERLRPGIR